MAEHIVKLCPRCHQPLEIKINRQTGGEFLGCSAWQPRNMGCGHTEPLPEAIVLRRQGQRGMFDEDEEESRSHDATDPTIRGSTLFAPHA